MPTRATISSSPSTACTAFAANGRGLPQLMMSTPRRKREDYLAELAWIAAEGVQLSAQEWTRLYARHDQCMV